MKASGNPKPITSVTYRVDMDDAQTGEWIPFIEEISTMTEGQRYEEATRKDYPGHKVRLVRVRTTVLETVME